MYQFEIFGVPTPQKQTRFSCRGGIPHAYDPSKKEKERIQWQVKPLAPKNALQGPLELTIWFFLPIPKATPSKRKLAMSNRVILPNIKPDIDNLAYIVTNALKNLVYEDDKQICHMRLYKLYGAEPKTVIRIRPIAQFEELGIHETDL